MKNEKINLETAIEKCDHIGASKAEILKKAKTAKRFWLDQSKENVEELHNYIFGKTDENPLQEIEDEVQRRFEHYDQKIDEYIEKVKKQSLKRKINK